VAEPAVGLHATHDPELIAGHAAGDLAPADQARAEGLVRACAACAALASDLAGIGAATAALRSVPPARPRDFRISAADAARLRRGSGLRRWLRPLASPRFGFAGPLGAGATAIALVGLLVGSLSGALGGAAGGAAFGNLATDSREAGPAETYAVPVAGPGGSLLIVASAAASAKAEPTGVAGQPTSTPTPEAPTPGAGGSVAAASLVLLVVGLGLLAGRGLARRLVGPAREP
jgi:hypothetical protein